MKICSICVKNDILCSACSRKVERGEISTDSATISRALGRLQDGADFIDSFEAAGRIYIIVDTQQMGSVIGKSGKNVRKLCEILGKQVKVLEKEGSKEMIEKALNIRVNGVNKVFGPEEFYRVRMDRKTKARLGPESGKVIEAIVGKSEIVFE
ncbi:MAG: KH domain-containing protein [Candidatus Aenigmarchaeota archaeon]|nr:KH domain-containing protein [Candidatus Aenigmarchaeota archaeon]